MISKFKILVFIFWVLLNPAISFGQVPEYYSNIDFLKSPIEIKSQLLELIKENHVFIPYTSIDTDVWDVLSISDMDLSSENKILLIYGYDDLDNEVINDRSRDVYNSQSSGGFDGKWNREHIFAKSLVFGTMGPDNNNIAYSDLHNLRAIDSRMNTRRNNNFFSDGNGNSGLKEDGFYPGDEWIGDVARTIMYMYLRYPDFALPSSVGLGPSNFSDDENMVDIFLKWNELDPPSEFEINRHEVIYEYQGNRNPFVDNPYLATLIWGGPIAIDLWTETTDDIIIYPMITSSEIYLDTSPFFIDFLGTYKDKSDEKFTYKLYNMDREEVQNGITSYKIDISDKMSGNYILELEIDKKIREVQIIKL